MLLRSISASDLSYTQNFLHSAISLICRISKFSDYYIIRSPNNILCLMVFEEIYIPWIINWILFYFLILPFTILFLQGISKSNHFFPHIIHIFSPQFHSWNVFFPAHFFLSLLHVIKYVIQMSPGLRMSCIKLSCWVILVLSSECLFL